MQLVLNWSSEAYLDPLEAGVASTGGEGGVYWGSDSAFVVSRA